MNRRRFIATIGAASLAGCTGTGESPRSGESYETTQAYTSADPDTPPHFEQVELDGPDSITVGDEFYLTLSAVNTGGQAGEFSTTVTFDPNSLASKNHYVKIADVQPGTRESKELGPFSFDVVGEWEYAITEYAASYTATTEPKTVALSEAVSSSSGLQVSINSLQYPTSLVYSSRYNGDGIASPDQGYQLVLADVEVRNTGNSKIESPWMSNFAVLVGSDRYEGLSGLGDADVTELKLPGKAYAPEGRLSAGGSARGWLLFEIPADATTENFKLGLNRGGNAYTDVQWVPENLPSTSAPSFEVVEFSAPASAEISSSASLELTVKNSGGRAGVYRAIVYQKEVNGYSNYEALEVIEEKIDAGETMSWSNGFTSYEEISMRYLLVPGEKTQTVKFESANRSLGEYYTGESGVEFAVTDLQFGDSYVSTQSYQNNPTEATDGEQFLFAKITVRNPTSASVSLPLDIRFKAYVNGTEEYRKPVFGDSIEQPMDAKVYSPMGNLPPDETVTGWIVYEVPSGTSVSDVKVAHSTYNWAVYWSS